MRFGGALPSSRTSRTPPAIAFASASMCLSRRLSMPSSGTSVASMAGALSSFLTVMYASYL